MRDKRRRSRVVFLFFGGGLPPDYLMRLQQQSSSPLLDSTGEVLLDNDDNTISSNAYWVDTVGLPISEFYAACPVAHRSIYSADGSAFYDAATIITNIGDSAELNDGSELVGSAAKGYAQYADGTNPLILLRAYQYFRVTYPGVPTYQEDRSVWLQEDGSQVYQEGV